MSEIERRRKVVYVDRDLLILVLNAMHRREYLQLPIIPEIPEGTIVLDVSIDFSRRALAVLIAHESFDIVEDGWMAPALQEDALSGGLFRRIKMPYASAGQVIGIAGEKLEKGDFVCIDMDTGKLCKSAIQVEAEQVPEWGESPMKAFLQVWKDSIISPEQATKMLQEFREGKSIIIPAILAGKTNGEIEDTLINWSESTEPLPDQIRESVERVRQEVGMKDAIENVKDMASRDVGTPLERFARGHLKAMMDKRDELVNQSREADETSREKKAESDFFRGE